MAKKQGLTDAQKKSILKRKGEILADMMLLMTSYQETENEVDKILILMKHLVLKKEYDALPHIPVEIIDVEY